MFRRTRADAGLAGRSSNHHDAGAGRRRPKSGCTPRSWHTPGARGPKRQESTASWRKARDDRAHPPRVQQRRIAGAVGRTAARASRGRRERIDVAASPALRGRLADDDEEPRAWLGSPACATPTRNAALLARHCSIVRAQRCGARKQAGLAQPIPAGEPRASHRLHRVSRHARNGSAAILPGIDAVQLHGGLTSAGAPGRAAAVHGGRRPPAARHRCGQRRSQSSSAMPPRHQPGAALDAGAARPARRTSRSHRAGAHGPRDPPGGGRHLRGVDRREARIACRRIPRCARARCRTKRSSRSPCSVPARLTTARTP